MFLSIPFPFLIARSFRPSTCPILFTSSCRERHQMLLRPSKFLPILEGLGISPQKHRLILNQNYRPFTGNLSPTDIEERLARRFNHLFPLPKTTIGIGKCRCTVLPPSPPNGSGFFEVCKRLVTEIESIHSSDYHSSLKTLQRIYLATIDRTYRKVVA